MRGGALPPALLCAALGFALAFAPRKVWPWALGLLAVCAVASSFLQFAPSWQDSVFLGCWASVVLAAASVHLPKGLGSRWALCLAVNTGFWAGAVIAAAGAKLDLLKSLPVVLVVLPAGWLVTTRRGIAVKVVASWLIAISILAAALPLTPTPGYKPDHMD